VSDTLTAIDRLIQRPRRTTSHRLWLDPNRADAIAQARQRVTVAQLMARDSKDPADAREVADAETALEEATAGADCATFHLQAVGAEVVDQLLVDCEPTKAQKERAKRLGGPVPAFDEDEVYCQLLAMAITSVLITGGDEAVIDGLTLDQMHDLWRSKTWPRDDLTELAEKAMALNKTATAAGALGNA